MGNTWPFPVKDAALERQGTEDCPKYNNRRGCYEVDA